MKAVSKIGGLPSDNFDDVRSSFEGAVDAAVRQQFSASAVASSASILAVSVVVNSATLESTSRRRALQNARVAAAQRTLAAGASYTFDVDYTVLLDTAVIESGAPGTKKTDLKPLQAELASRTQTIVSSPDTVTRTKSTIAAVCRP